MTNERAKIVGRLGVRGLDAAHLVLSDPVLARSPFIRALGDRAESVLEESRVYRLRPDGVAFASGRPADSVILVAAGEISVRVAGEAEGIVAGTVPVGEITGAEAALGHAERISTATATGEAVVVAIPVSAFADLLTDGSPLAECLLAAKDRDASAADDMADFLDRW